MRGSVWAIVFSAATCLPGLVAQERGPKPIMLSPIPLKNLHLRPGYDFAGRDIPATGWQARIVAQTWVFVDLNGDGVLGAETDGIALPPTPFVVPIPEVLLVPKGQSTLTFDGTKSLSLGPVPLGRAEGYAADASLINELRIRAGVRLAALDERACADCEKHCDFLKLNRMEAGDGGMSAHTEPRDKPGFTPEGAAAGAGSCIGFKEAGLKPAILGWYATAWHGPPILDPALTRFGVALKYGVAMFYASSHGATAKRRSLHPADGATDIPASFGSRGELPNPVPGTRYGIGCGFPILIQLTDPTLELTAAIVKDPTGKTVLGTMSCPAHPATKEWPSNSDCAVFIPAVPLSPRTKYAVRFEFGAAGAVEWNFTTADR